MVDYFAIALTHGLIALAVWRLMTRDDLDQDGAEDGGPDDSGPRRPWLKDRDA